MARIYDFPTQPRLITDLAGNRFLSLGDAPPCPANTVSQDAQGNCIDANNQIIPTTAVVTPTSILVDPSTGNYDPQRLTNLVGALQSAINEASRVATAVQTRVNTDSAWYQAICPTCIGASFVSAANQAAIPILADLKTSLARLAQYQSQLNAAAADPNMTTTAGGVWTAAPLGSDQGAHAGMLPYNVFLQTIQNETKYNNESIATLAAAEATPGFWSDLLARVDALLADTYAALQAVGQAVLPNIQAALDVLQYLPWIVGGALFAFYVLPTLLDTGSAYKKGGSSAAADAAARSLRAGRDRVESGAKGAASAATTAALLGMGGRFVKRPYKRRKAKV